MSAPSGPDGLPQDELGGQEVLTISSRREATHVVVTLIGELDLHGTVRLVAAVQSALVDAPIDVLDIDLRGLSFADSSGLQAVLTARDSVRLAGVTFRVIGVSPAVRRVIRIAGVEHELLPAGEDDGSP